MRRNEHIGGAGGETGNWVNNVRAQDSAVLPSHAETSPPLQTHQPHQRTGTWLDFASTSTTPGIDKQR